MLVIMMAFVGQAKIVTTAQMIVMVRVGGDPQGVSAVEMGSRKVQRTTDGVMAIIKYPIRCHSISEYRWINVSRDGHQNVWYTKTEHFRKKLDLSAHQLQTK